MAIMINCKADALIEKENILWKSIKDNLPDNVICYCNCEVEGRVISFCLLIEDVGLFIIESRDWIATDITEVTSSGEIKLMSGNGEVVSEISPRRKAKVYQLALTGTLNDKYNINPSVYSVV